MVQMKLTKRNIIGIRPDPERELFFWDTEICGFGLRVKPHGWMSYLIQYRNKAGRTRKMGLGRHGTVTPAEARQRATQLLAAAKRGEDPSEERSVTRKAETVKALAETFVEQYSMPHKKSWREDRRRIDKYILPALGRMRVEAVKRSDIVRLHNRIGKDEGHPREANNVRNLLQTMFRFATENGFVPEDHPNPAKRIEKFPEKSRDRWIQPGELPQILESIEAELDPFVRGFFLLALLTGLRKSELLGLRWKDIDFDRCELKIEETKGGRRHYLPLSKPAIQVLKALPRFDDNGYVLCGHVKGQPLVNVQKPWKRIRDRAGLPDLRIHDLRRTVGSWLATSGASLQLVGRVLGHADSRTTESAYAHLSQDPIREALQEYGDKVLDFTKIKKEKVG